MRKIYVGISKKSEKYKDKSFTNMRFYQIIKKHKSKKPFVVMRLRPSEGLHSNKAHRIPQKSFNSIEASKNYLKEKKKVRFF